MDSDTSNSRFSSNRKLLLFGVLISSILATPVVYGAVEPHIKVTMDASQTTKPLQIVNSLDQEVFSVDVDGTIFPSQVSDNLNSFDNMKILHYTLNGETSDSFTTAIGDLSDYTEIALWRVDFADPTDNEVPVGGALPFVVTGSGALNGFIKSSTISFADISLVWSFDQSTWQLITSEGDDEINQFHGITTTGQLFDGSICQRSTGGGTAGTPLQSCYISLRYGLGDLVGGATTVTLKNIELLTTVILPQDTTITRVL